MTAEETMEVGANLVAGGRIQVMTLCASRLEQVGALLRVTWDVKSVPNPSSGKEARSSEVQETTSSLVMPPVRLPDASDPVSKKLQVLFTSCATEVKSWSMMRIRKRKHTF